MANCCDNFSRKHAREFDKKNEQAFDELETGIDDARRIAIEQ